MNRRKRGNKRYKTERAFLVRFSTISILIGLIQFSHFFLSRSFVCIVFAIRMQRYRLRSFSDVGRKSAAIMRSVHGYWTIVLLAGTLFYFSSVVFRLFCLHFTWMTHAYILSMSIAAWPLIIRIGFPRAEHTFAFFAVGRSSIAKLLIQYVKTLR